MGERRLGEIQTVEPAAQGGRSGEAVGIFDHRRRLLPGTTLHKAASQRLAAGDQAVMAVGWRELRQEGEGLVARPAPAASTLRRSVGGYRRLKLRRRNPPAPKGLPERR